MSKGCFNVSLRYYALPVWLVVWTGNFSHSLVVTDTSTCIVSKFVSDLVPNLKSNFISKPQFLVLGLFWYKISFIQLESHELCSWPVFVKLILMIKHLRLANCTREKSLTNLVTLLVRTFWHLIKIRNPYFLSWRCLFLCYLRYDRISNHAKGTSFWFAWVYNLITENLFSFCFIFTNFERTYVNKC